MRSDVLRNDVIVTGNGNCKFEFVKAIDPAEHGCFGSWERLSLQGHETSFTAFIWRTLL